MGVVTIKLRAPSAGVELAAAPLNGAAAAASKIKDRLLDSSDLPCQQHLGEYAGRLLLVGGFLPGDSPAESQDAVERATRLLGHSHSLVAHGRTIGIRPMIPDTQTDEPETLVATTQALRQSLVENYDVTVIAEEDPILCGDAQSGCGPAEACEALHKALTRFEAEAGLPGGDPSLGFVAVVNAGYAGRNLDRFHVGSLENGGVVELRSVGRQPQDNVWVAY